MHIRLCGPSGWDLVRATCTKQGAGASLGSDGVLPAQSQNAQLQARRGPRRLNGHALRPSRGAGEGTMWLPEVPAPLLPVF